MVVCLATCLLLVLLVLLVLLLLQAMSASAERPSFFSPRSLSLSVVGVCVCVCCGVCGRVRAVHPRKQIQMYSHLCLQRSVNLFRTLIINVYIIYAPASALEPHSARGGPADSGERQCHSHQRRPPRAGIWTNF